MDFIKNKIGEDVYFHVLGRYAPDEIIENELFNENIKRSLLKFIIANKQIIDKNISKDDIKLTNKFLIHGLNKFIYEHFGRDHIEDINFFKYKFPNLKNIKYKKILNNINKKYDRLKQYKELMNEINNINLKFFHMFSYNYENNYDEIHEIITGEKKSCTDINIKFFNIATAINDGLLSYNINKKKYVNKIIKFIDKYLLIEPYKLEFGKYKNNDLLFMIIDDINNGVKYRNYISYIMNHYKNNKYNNLNMIKKAYKFYDEYYLKYIVENEN